MPIEYIHSYLVHPSKLLEEAPAIRGATVQRQGKLFELLNGVYATSGNECDIEIAFRPTTDGRQENPCRSLIIDYAQSPNITRGRKIASRLASMSDRRSGIGLLFLVTGTEDRATHRVVLSRFPTDQAILAEEQEDSLSVSFLERVFLKNRHSYKAAIYDHRSFMAGFWTGHAVDKQHNTDARDYPNYWISGFLDSELAVTSAAGTERLATAIKYAAKNAPSPEVKREIVAAAILAPNLRGQRTSIDDFGRRFSLSPQATDAIRNQLKSPRAAEEQFHFDEAEFKSVVAYVSVELDNGGQMTAPSLQFDEIFNPEPVAGTDNEMKFSTRGRVIDQKLKKAP